MANCYGTTIVFAVLFIAELIKNGLSVELRCYCNLPDCVHTAYMCKSEIGCFQELHLYPKTNRDPPRIGCLELWNKKKPFQCLQLSTDRAMPPITTTTEVPLLKKRKGLFIKHMNPKTTFLRCCLEDMCNYVPQNTDLNAGVLRDEKDVSVSFQDIPRKPTDSSSGTEAISGRLWFRVAVIAVPIFGGIILVILILLACALLRSDWRKVSDNDRLLAPSCGDSERCVSPRVIAVDCEKLAYRPKPFPGYLRGQLRQYHSDTTLVICSEKAKERPNTALFPDDKCYKLQSS